MVEDTANVLGLGTVYGTAVQDRADLRFFQRRLASQRSSEPSVRIPRVTPRAGHLIRATSCSTIQPRRSLQLIILPTEPSRRAHVNERPPLLVLVSGGSIASSQLVLVCARQTLLSGGRCWRVRARQLCVSLNEHACVT